MTRRSILQLLFATIIAAIPIAPAAAQDADFWSRELSRSQTEYLRTVRPFADCLVMNQAKEIPKFLGTARNNSWVARDMAKAHPECPHPKSADQDTAFLLQGAVLEALVRRDFGNVAAPASFDQVPPFVYVKETSNELVRKMIAWVMEAYDCTTRRDPAKVQALLRTDPLSREEVVAFASLRSAIAGCQPKDETWVLRPYMARRYLAETFYSLMKVDQRRKMGAQ